MSNTSKTNWARVDALTEAEIDTTDIPAQGDEFFARAHWRLPSQDTQTNALQNQVSIVLEPAVAAVFADAAAVNQALRSLIQATESSAA